VETILNRLRPTCSNHGIQWLLDADEGQVTPLIAACVLDEPETVQQLVDICGHDVDEGTAASGVTAAMVAAGEGKSKCLMALIELGADCSQGDNDGYTPAHLAAWKGWVDCLQLLHGHCDLDAVSGTGERPIQQAAENKNSACVALLSKYGFQ
jgi:ankyrin repeat protein